MSTSRSTTSEERVLEQEARWESTSRQAQQNTPEQLRLEYSCDLGVPDEAEQHFGNNSSPSPFLTDAMSANSLVSPTFYEFFAGGGMARLGLGPNWRCLFANEWSQKKAATYREYFKSQPIDLAQCDVAALSTADLPARPDLVWASFPCQDLSLAGNGAGLAGTRSGTFKPFWQLISSLSAEGRGPGVVVLENVVGALTSHEGKDFEFIIKQIVDSGYRVGALVLDAVRFLPQSRPRLFIVAIQREIRVSTELSRQTPLLPWHTASLVNAYRKLPDSLRASWIWWSAPTPASCRLSLHDLIDPRVPDSIWHTTAETKRLVAMMSETNRVKLRKLTALSGRQLGTIYKRTRPEKMTGERVQRAELRCDGIAGCLRTPAGGSSRQILLVVEGRSIRTRLLTAREAARLMGIPEDYSLPKNYNEAYHLAGDGLAVPVVAWLSTHLLTPLVCGIERIVAA